LLFDTLCRELQPLVDARPLALSFEISEIDPVLNYKGGNIREYLAKRGTA
jgi:5-carboxymethyl-2-hydroxymuconate isomerase